MKLLLSLILSIFISTSAYAHVSLVSSMPANGAELDTAPNMLMLTLSTQARVTGIEMVNEDGEEITVGDLPAEMTTMAHIALPKLTSGKYTITWRATSKDMHAMSGKITFSVK